MESWTADQADGCCTSRPLRSGSSESDSSLLVTNLLSRCRTLKWRRLKVEWNNFTGILLSYLVQQTPQLISDFFFLLLLQGAQQGRFRTGSSSCQPGLRRNRLPISTLLACLSWWVWDGFSLFGFGVPIYANFIKWNLPFRNAPQHI